MFHGGGNTLVFRSGLAWTTSVGNSVDPAIAHPHRAVAAAGEFRIVGGENQSPPARADQFDQQIKNPLAVLLIERAGRFVAEQQLRIIHQRADQRTALALAAGELAHPLAEPMLDAGRHRQFLQAGHARQHDFHPPR